MSSWLQGQSWTVKGWTVSVATVVSSFERTNAFLMDYIAIERPKPPSKLVHTSRRPATRGHHCRPRARCPQRGMLTLRCGAFRLPANMGSTSSGAMMVAMALGASEGRCKSVGWDREGEQTVRRGRLNDLHFYSQAG